MTELPFSIDLIRALAEHRTGLLTAFFLATTFVGDVGGYVVGIAALAVKYEDAIQRRWSELSSSQQVLSLVGASALLWSITVALNGWTIGEQPRAFLSYTGFLTGTVVGHGLETTHVRFDPRSSAVISKLLRYAISVAVVLSTLLALDPLLELLAADSSALGHALRYVRYATAGIAGTFLAPLLFTRLGWAERMPTPEGERPLDLDPSLLRGSES